MGMRATQSHAVRLENAPAVRLATDRPLEQITGAALPPIEAFFVAVVLGVLDEALATARAQIRDKADTLRAYSGSSGRGPSRTTGSCARPTKVRCGRSSPVIPPSRSTPPSGPSSPSPSSPSRRWCA